MRIPLLVAAVAIHACRPGGDASAFDSGPFAASVEAARASVGDAAPDVASPSVDAAPPYSLASDLASRRSAALALFAPSVPSTLVVGDVFLLVSPQGPAMLAAGADTLRRALAFYYSGPFTRHADHAVTVYLFATRQAYLDFSAAHYPHAGASGLFGYFARTPREIVIRGNEGLGTLQHEMIHPILENEMDAPVWIDEGIGSLFEQAVTSPDGTMHGRSNGRYVGLRKALQADAGAPPSIAALFGMTDHDFRGGSPRDADGGVDEQAKMDAQLLHYGLARSFCQWLDSPPHHKLWDFYHAWRDGFATDRTGDKAFVATMGGSPAAFDAEWRTWVIAHP